MPLGYIRAIPSRRILHADRLGVSLCKTAENVLASLVGIDRAERVDIPIVIEPERAGRMAFSSWPFVSHVAGFVVSQVP